MTYTRTSQTPPTPKKIHHDAFHHATDCMQHIIFIYFYNPSKCPPRILEPTQLYFIYCTHIQTALKFKSNGS